MASSKGVGSMFHIPSIAESILWTDGLWIEDASFHSLCVLLCGGSPANTIQCSSTHREGRASGETGSELSSSFLFLRSED